MRIPFPERVNLTHALIFATGLSGLQMIQGTNPFFSGCVFCIILVAAVGFNIAGGVAYPSGAFILFNAIFTIVLPCTAKALLGFPADAFLRSPLRTVEVYLCGMVGMFVAAVFSRRFRTRRALIAGMLPREGLRSAYVGSAVLSVILTFLMSAFPAGQNGTFGSFLIQANRFPMLTFVLGVIYTVHRTNGRRSMSWPLLGMILYFSLGALFTFSKEQLLAPLFAWAITAALLQYRLHWINVVAMGVGTFLVVTYMIPYAAYGRGYVAPNTDRTQAAAYLLTHMDEVRQGYEETIAIYGNVHFYDRNRGLLSRLEVFSVDDALIDLTDREGTFGYEPIIASIENLVPHAIWADKPATGFNNTYAHEIGILSEEDNTTGVSFSPSADAYHEGRMLGVMVFEPLMLIVCFLVLDSVIGDVRMNPVGLLTTILVSRAASEGTIAGLVYLINQPLFTNVLAALVCAYVLPVLGYAFAKSPFSAGGRKLPPSIPLPPASLPQTVSNL
jgi:hypothetical protein